MIRQVMPPAASLFFFGSRIPGRFAWEAEVCLLEDPVKG